MNTTAHRLRHHLHLVVFSAVSAALIAKSYGQAWLPDDIPASMAMWAAIAVTLALVLTRSAGAVAIVFAGLCIVLIWMGVGAAMEPLLGPREGWMRLVYVGLSLALMGAFFMLPVARHHAKTDTIAINAPRDAVWDVFLPVDSGRYWKPNMRVEAVEGAEAEYRVVLTGAGPHEGGSTRIKLTDIVPGKTFTMCTVDDRQNPEDVTGTIESMQVIDMQDHLVAPRTTGTRIVSTFVVRRPTLHGLGILYLFDPSGDELRRLKAHLEGTVDATFGSTIC